MGTVGILFFAIKERSRRLRTGKLFNGWRVTLDFGIRRARRHAKLSREDVEDTSETDECAVFGDGVRWEFIEV